jgi:uncharacterized protein YjbJ (UPF0337 family)
MLPKGTGDKIAGAIQFLKGRLKARSGSRAGNAKRRLSGRLDQLKGALRNKKGHAKARLK